MTANGKVSPYSLAMVVCDQMVRDPFTGKWSLLGTFSAIGGSSFPLVHPILSVYVSLTDGRGRIPIRLELVDVDETRDPVFSLESEVEFVDPREVVEGAFCTTNLEFPEPGEYRLKLFANQEFLLERRIVIVARHRESGD